MRNINEKLENLDKKLDVVIENINNLTQAVAVLSERVDGIGKTLDARIDDLRVAFFYLIAALVLTVIILPFLSGWYEKRAKQEIKNQVGSFTLDDVKKLIEENNVMLLTKLQGGAI